VASYRDLLDAIARVRAATGRPDAWQEGLTGADVAVACTPLSRPAALAAVLAKLTAAHPTVFGPTQAPDSSPPTNAQGATADAISAAQSALAQQRSDAAELDLKVLTAIANAHGTAADGLTRLSQLQREIETAVASRTDLDTPAGARELQRFLIGKIRDIRDVVQNAGLDAASQAALAAALAALYIASTLETADRGSSDSRETRTAPAWNGQEAESTTSRANPSPPRMLDDVPPHYLPDQPVADQFVAEQLPVSDLIPLAPPPAAWTSAAAPTTLPLGGAGPMTPPFGGAGPMTPPFGGAPSLGGSPWPGLFPAGLSKADLPGHDAPDSEVPQRPGDPASPPDDSDAEDVSAEVKPAAAEPTPVLLPDGQTVIAPSPGLASVIAAAVAGAPIGTAFSWQGITIPAPGSPVEAPVDPTLLLPGDIGVLADRHALALGNGTALLDQQIQPVSSVAGPGFRGWQHPPDPDPISVPLVLPAPDRSPATAPS
jgi:hypothetical protein